MVLTSAYDAASNRTKLTSTIGGTADFENDYSYDNLNRLTRVDQIGQGGGNTVASKRVDFAYDDASRLTSIVRNYKPSGSWVEVATTALSYDNINRLTGIDHKQGGSSLFTAYSYTFDNANRITGITSQDGTVDYTYDSTSQITSADYSYQTDESFTWDANGNRDDTGYTTGANNKMTSDGVYNYSYDHEGNLVLRVKISDSSRTEYTWDYRNRLTNITQRATEFGAATMTVDYVYDPYDRRLTKSYDADGAGGGSAVTSHFVYDGSDNAQVILQFDDSNNLTHRDLWALDQIFADEDSGNDILWSLGDDLGTVRDVIDSTGSVQNHLTYDAFGAVTSETASAVDFLMGFAGMVRDEETGASYAWHRYQQSGRWLSEDPAGFLAKDPNLQRVVGNCVTDFIDPTGLAGTRQNRGRRDEWYDWVNPFVIFKGVARLDSMWCYHVSDVISSHGYPGFAEYPEFCGNLGGIVEGICDVANPNPFAVATHPAEIILTEADRANTTFNAARGDGYSGPGSVGLASAVVVGDVIGSTNLEEAIEGQELFTDRPLTTSDRGTHVAIMSIKVVGSASLVTGGLDAAGLTGVRPVAFRPPIEQPLAGPSYAPNPLIELIGQGHGLAAEASSTGAVAAHPLQGLYGPFFRSEPAAAIPLIQQSHVLRGNPPTNIYQSHIPTVQAFPGQLPAEATGIQFYTPAEPQLVPGLGGTQAWWRGQPHTSTHTIPIVVTGFRE